MIATTFNSALMWSRPSRRDFAANIGLALGFLASLAFAGESAVSLIAAGMPAACAEYAANVTSSEGSFRSISPSVNGVRCYGTFQFCDNGTLQSYWSGTKEGFLADQSAQVVAWRQYEQNGWTQANRLGMTQLIGQQVCFNGTCAIISQSSILKACQFGCGKGGKLYNLMKAGLDCNAAGTRDGAGTSVCSYLISGAGYNVACVTNSNDGTDCLPATPGGG